MAAYELFSSTEVLGRMALERMLAGLPTRRYPVGLEPVNTRADQAATSTLRSAVSRRFVAATETALAQLLAADLSGLDLVALKVDGCTSASTPAWSPWASTSTGPSTRWRWWKARRRNTMLVTELIVGQSRLLDSPPTGIRTRRPSFAA